MKRHMVAQLLVLSFILVVSSFAIARSIRLATYNIRRIGKEDVIENQWVHRKDLVFDMVHKIKPTIIGFQEVVEGQQYDELKEALLDYGSFGISRGKKKAWGWQSFVMQAGAKKGHSLEECNPLFYDRSKIELIASGDFGINPGFIGSWFVANLPRICTWGFFKDKETGKKFYVYNTHLYQGFISTYRHKQIDMILKDIKKRTQDLPVIFMGDFNLCIGYKKLIDDKKCKNGSVSPNKFKDFSVARDVAQQVEGPQDTRTGWSYKRELKAIDHILVTKGMTVRKFKVMVSPENTYPSDHRPVVADVLIK